MSRRTSPRRLLLLTALAAVLGVAGGGAAWVRAPAGRTVTVRVREFRGSKVVQARTSTVTATGAWQQVTVASSPAAGGTSISIDVLASLGTSDRAQVDDVSLRRT